MANGLAKTTNIWLGLKDPQTNAVTLVAVLIVSTVAAGHPILAHENITGEVLVEASAVGSGKCFAL